jgi:hypothetical protein
MFIGTSIVDQKQAQPTLRSEKSVENWKSGHEERFVQLQSFVFAFYEFVPGTRMGTGFLQEYRRPWDRRQVGQHVV